ncbi:hypothetical protein AGR4A_pAt10142 [Agrobacterium tumefaciens str. B6]|uniref:Uncharacterized protein n=1 Tax=Agrobacterium tumefaciens str. B6 TaxID=1183423 RepID=A0A822VA21_AGRTU|nr:hypothetical protein AGR4A_pAt10142 [Agrobacterium tumefaciens str. B6]
MTSATTTPHPFSCATIWYSMFFSMVFKPPCSVAPNCDGKSLFLTVGKCGRPVSLGRLAQDFAYFVQVGDEGALLLIRLLPVAKAQQVRRMNGDEKTCAARRQKDMSAFLRHTACPSRQRIKGRGAHRHDKVWIDKAQFRSQPPGAALYFTAVWPGV